MRDALALIAALLLSATAASSQTGAAGREPTPDDSRVARLGWSPSILDAAIEEVRGYGSAAGLIVTDGEVVRSWGDVTAKYRAHSIRKSFLSALIGIYHAEGRIDLDQNLAQLGIDDEPPLTPQERTATVLDMLGARSGVYHPAASETTSMREHRPARGSHKPGTHWYYNNWDFNALGTIFEQETGVGIFEAFQERLAAPLSMEDFQIDEDTRYQLEPEHSTHRSYKFRISARDLARFGQLYLQNGQWRGARVVPQDWVTQSTSAHSVTGEKGTKASYGYMWWVAEADEVELLREIPVGAFTASGTGGQRCTVFPALRTVVVNRVDTDDRGGPRMRSSQYDRFLTNVLAARTSPRD